MSTPSSDAEPTAIDWNELTMGASMLTGATEGERLALEHGFRLATRHEHVTLDPSCRISPEARINPRQGAIAMGPRGQIALGAIVQGNVRFGTNCSVQAYSTLIGYGSRDNPNGQITIGDNVRIAPYVMMIAANHNFADPDRPICEQGLTAKPITIEDDVWVGGRVSVMAGVTIGRGSVIGAGAVVTKDIPPYSIAVGVPAKVVGSRKQP